MGQRPLVMRSDVCSAPQSQLYRSWESQLPLEVAYTLGNQLRPRYKASQTLVAEDRITATCVGIVILMVSSFVFILLTFHYCLSVQFEPDSATLIW